MLPYLLPLLVLCLLSPRGTAQHAQAQTLRVEAGGGEVSASTLRRIEVMAQAGLVELEPRLRTRATRPIRILVHRSRADLPPRHRRDLPEGVPGFALLGRDELHLVLGQIKQMPPNDLRTTLRHELVHVLLDQLLGPAGPYVARWFHEGIAQDLAEGVYLNMKEEELLPWLLSGNLPSFQVLDRTFPRRAGRQLAVAYAQSQSFFHHLRGEFGLAQLLEWARLCTAERRFADVIREETGKAQVHWEQRWQKYLREESGAGWRVLLRNCFSFAVILALPLLALAMARRRNRNQRLLDRMAAEEAREDEERRRAAELAAYLGLQPPVSGLPHPDPPLPEPEPGDPHDDPPWWSEDEHRDLRER